jgi:hypothetical protein
VIQSLIGFRQLSRVFPSLVVSVALFNSPQAFAAPTAAIAAMATSGQAPFTVHVHGLNSTIDVGTKMTARYEWDFGDAAGSFNKLVGWNAAHTFNQAGTYTVKLKVTNQAGQQHTASLQVNVAAATRTKIYVSPSGSDSNNGLSTSSPIKTVAKAATMLGNNKEILFQRNATYDMSNTFTITQQNLIIGAYGTGSNPKWNYTVNAQYGKMINMGDSSKDVIIENIQFDSPFAPNNLIIRAIHPHGTNITVRNCYFGKVSYAMNADGGGVYGLLTQGNTTGVIGAYYIWAQGNDHTHLGNTVGGSVDEHNIRYGNVSRSLIAHNELTNTSKSTIWLMLGDNCYVANNTLKEGRFIAGPNFATSSPGERFLWVVFENNQIINEGVILYSGAENITFRNNVIKNNGGECFSIWGYYAQWNRTCKNISILNNSAFNESSQYGRFIKMGTDAENVVVGNNLYCATNLNVTNGAANVRVDDNLNTHSFFNNLWAVPGNGTNPHYLSTGGQSVTQWANLSQTDNESYRDYSSTDVDAAFVPQFDATVGVSIIGVNQDFYGNPRPAIGDWTVGAVEQSPDGPSEVFADVNADGVVDVDDLLAVLNTWGACAGCGADIDGDGGVDVDDLLAVLNNWS